MASRLFPSLIGAPVLTLCLGAAAAVASPYDAVVELCSTASSTESVADGLEALGLHLATDEDGKGLLALGWAVGAHRVAAYRAHDAGGLTDALKVALQDKWNTMADNARGTAASRLRSKQSEDFYISTGDGILVSLARAQPYETDTPHIWHVRCEVHSGDEPMFETIWSDLAPNPPSSVNPDPDWTQTAEAERATGPRHAIRRNPDRFRDAYGVDLLPTRTVLIGGPPVEIIE